MPSLKQTPVDGSQDFNLFTLRRLFNPGNAGRGAQGEIRRVDFHATLTPVTMYTLGQRVPRGQGRYTSPVVELSLRIVLALIGALNLDTVAEEIAVAFTQRSTIVMRLKMLAAKVEAYQKE